MWNARNRNNNNNVSNTTTTTTKQLNGIQPNYLLKGNNGKKTPKTTAILVDGCVLEGGLGLKNDWLIIRLL